MLWCHEDNRVGYPDPLAELRPRRRRIFVAVLIVNRQVSDFDDAELQRSGRIRAAYMPDAARAGFRVLPN